MLLNRKYGYPVVTVRVPSSDRRRYYRPLSNNGFANTGYDPRKRLLAELTDQSTLLHGAVIYLKNREE